ncbi:MAG TPA: ATP-binding protein [Candidatus Dormibacteraeota bacterium]|jgi:two-component system sensor histidine kinase UhpB|nr:ATP-binding protein [Candidatus Dormibacteraeota bacterium]
MDATGMSELEQLIKRELARELHDQVVQDLTTMLVELEIFKIGGIDRQTTLQQIEAVQGSLRGVLGRLRGLLYGLRDEEAWEVGFVGSLRAFAARHRARTGTRVLVRARREWPDPIRRPAAHHLRAIVQEATHNAQRHGAASAVWVTLGVDEPGLASVTIRDDGRGLIGDALSRPGLGLLGMHERALLLGGRLAVRSRPAQGTSVRVVLPRAALT